MPRPASKQDLLDLMESEHQKLDALVQSLPPTQRGKVSRQTGWSILDVLAHLSEWEQLCVGWYKTGLTGKQQQLPAKGYNWAQIPALNQKFLEENRTRTPAAILKRYAASYRNIRKTLEGIREKDLFERGKFSWTNRNNMATYFISATSSHYVWAIKEVKKCLK